MLSWNNIAIDDLKALADKSKVHPLTGLTNYQELWDRLTRLSRRQRDLPFSIIAIDLTGFKAINDTFGHQAGDAALCHVAEFFSSTIRSSDAIVCHPHGDEFLVVLMGSSAEEAKVVMSRLQTIPSFDFKGEKIQVGCALGSASASRVPTTLPVWQELLQQADLAMYEHKRTQSNAR